MIKQYMGEYNKAIEDFTSAINGNFASYYLRGQCYAILEQHDKAIEDFTAIVLCPNIISTEMTNVYLSRAWSYASLEHHDKAIEDYKKVIEITSNLDPKHEEEIKEYIKNNITIH